MTDSGRSIDSIEHHDSTEGAGRKEVAAHILVSVPLLGVTHNTLAQVLSHTDENLLLWSLTNQESEPGSGVI